MVFFVVVVLFSKSLIFVVVFVRFCMLIVYNNAMRLNRIACKKKKYEAN